MNPLILAAAAFGLVAVSRPKRTVSKKDSSKAIARPQPQSQPAQPVQPQVLPAECSTITTQGGLLAGVDYIEFVTAGAGPNDALPMVISLHGLNYDNTAHVEWLRKLARPVRVILPNGFFQKVSSVRRAWWDEYSDQALKDASRGLANFVYTVQQCRPTLGRPILTGHSMGGFVALDFATQFPELISAAVPVAATRSRRLWDVIPGVPVHGIHGELDSTFRRANEYYYEMSQRGLPIAMTVIPDAPHRITSDTAEPWRQILSGLIPQVIA